MANEEHVAILKKGVNVWNQWRKDNPSVKIDLYRADIGNASLGITTNTGQSTINLNYREQVRGQRSEAHLNSVDLRGANLIGANLFNTQLVEAQFNDADLSYSTLMFAGLERAVFDESRLTGANLTGADISGATFKGAMLRETNLTRTYLRDTDFSGANFSYVTLVDVDLSMAGGLEAIHHGGPSQIGIDTIYMSGGNIPEAFLRGAGVSDTFITFMKSLTNHAIDFYSCFISHSSKDKEFAERLYADLKSNGVRCWYAPHHMEIGAPILNEIDKAIRVHDKLLLILSENSVDSRWVEHEVLSATTKEFQQERDKRTLFPIRLDDAVMDTDVQWARNLKDTRHIADFTGWKDHDSYKKAFDRLMRDLKGKS